jgi:hypothetical protein
MKMERRISTAMAMTGFDLAKETMLIEVSLMKDVKAIKTPFENYILIIAREPASSVPHRICSFNYYTISGAVKGIACVGRSRKAFEFDWIIMPAFSLF